MAKDVQRTFPISFKPDKRPGNNAYERTSSIPSSNIGPKDATREAAREEWPKAFEAASKNCGEVESRPRSLPQQPALSIHRIVAFGLYQLPLMPPFCVCPPVSVATTTTNAAAAALVVSFSSSPPQGLLLVPCPSCARPICFLINKLGSFDVS